MNGNKVYYWNIMSNTQMSIVANRVPMALEELSACELPQNTMQLYGHRLINGISSFIEQQNLQQYIENWIKQSVLTSEALVAMDAAVASAVDGWYSTIDPGCLRHAIAQGIPEEQVKKAAKIAVEQQKRERRRKNEEEDQRYRQNKEEGLKHISEFVALVDYSSKGW